MSQASTFLNTLDGLIEYVKREPLDWREAELLRLSATLLNGARATERAVHVHRAARAAMNGQAGTA